MRILHTSDWHVGRTVRGRSRADEHRAVLDEIVGIARERDVDLTVVAGDQFDVQAPSPEAEQIVWQALVALARVAPVVVVAGNHDNPRRLAAVQGLLAAHRIHAVTGILGPDDGGVLPITAADGTPARVATLPFLHQRNAVKAADLLDPDKGTGEYGQDYSHIVGAFVSHLCRDLPADTVNLLVAHLTTFGGTMGGGERDAHTVMRYCVDPRGFPSTLDYVALGHLHEAQTPQGSAPPVHYCGSPLVMDFGEGGQTKHVLLVDAEPGTTAAVQRIPLASGRGCRTLTGTLEALLDGSDPQDDDWLRVIVQGDHPAGVAETVRAHLGERVVDVRLDVRPDLTGDAPGQPRLGRAPTELFAEYLAERGVTDERVPALFARLLEQEQEAANAAA